MKTRVAVALVCVFFVVLTVVTIRAQRRTVPGSRDAEVTAGIVIAGPDVGFRVERYDGSTPVGELVVKRDGKWMPVQFGARIQPMR